MTKKTKTKAQKKAEEDANLDEALAETFPASDPPSMTQPRTGADAPQRRSRRHPKGEVPPWKIISNEVVRCEPILLFEFAHQFQRRPRVPPSLDQKIICVGSRRAVTGLVVMPS